VDQKHLRVFFFSLSHSNGDPMTKSLNESTNSSLSFTFQQKK